MSTEQRLTARSTDTLHSHIVFLHYPSACLALWRPCGYEMPLPTMGEHVWSWRIPTRLTSHDVSLPDGVRMVHGIVLLVSQTCVTEHCRKFRTPMRLSTCRTKTECFEGSVACHTKSIKCSRGNNDMTTRHASIVDFLTMINTLLWMWFICACDTSLANG